MVEPLPEVGSRRYRTLCCSSPEQIDRDEDQRGQQRIQALYQHLSHEPQSSFILLLNKKL